MRDWITDGAGKVVPFLGAGHAHSGMALAARLLLGFTPGQMREAELSSCGPSEWDEEHAKPPSRTPSSAPRKKNRRSTDGRMDSEPKYGTDGTTVDFSAAEGTEHGEDEDAGEPPSPSFETRPGPGVHGVQ